MMPPVGGLSRSSLAGAQEVYPRLFLGGRRSALDRNMLKERGILSVLTISESPPPTLPDDVEGMYIHLRDSPSEVDEPSCTKPGNVKIFSFSMSDPISQ